VDCVYKARDQIAQVIVERIANAGAMQVDDLRTPERGKGGYGSRDLDRKQSITAKEGVNLCFLHRERSNHEFFSATDIGYDPWLMSEREILSTDHVNAALMRTMNN